MDQTRRALLRRTTALAATAGLAGCSALSGDDSTETPTDGSTGSMTATDTPATTPIGGPDGQAGRWLAPPSVLNREQYSFVTLHPTAMADHADVLPAERTANFDTQVGLQGFETVGSLRSVHQTGIGLTVYDGPFERSPLVSQLTEAGFSSDGSYREFDVYSADATRVVAVGDRQVAQVDLRRFQTSVTAGTVMQAGIDAYTGTGARYGASDSAAGALLGALGSGHVVTCQPSSTAIDADAALGQGGRWLIGSDTTSVAVATVFESASATDADAVESWAGASGPFGDATPTVSTDGRVVLAEADVSTGRLGPFEIASGGDQPQVALNFAYDSEAGTVTITHHGGDAVPADRLELRGEGFADRDGADQTSAGQWAGEASGDENAVVAGDSVVVGVTPAYRVLVLYTRESGSGVTLGSDRGPDA